MNKDCEQIPICSTVNIYKKSGKFVKFISSIENFLNQHVHTHISMDIFTIKKFLCFLEKFNEQLSRTNSHSFIPFYSSISIRKSKCFTIFKLAWVLGYFLQTLFLTRSKGRIKNLNPLCLFILWYVLRNIRIIGSRIWHISTSLYIIPYI